MGKMRERVRDALFTVGLCVHYFIHRRIVALSCAHLASFIEYYIHDCNMVLFVANFYCPAPETNGQGGRWGGGPGKSLIQGIVEMREWKWQKGNKSSNDTEAKKASLLLESSLTIMQIPSLCVL
jgi:hypothetical protein